MTSSTSCRPATITDSPTRSRRAPDGFRTETAASTIFCCGSRPSSDSGSSSSRVTSASGALPWHVPCADNSSPRPANWLCSLTGVIMLEELTTRDVFQQVDTRLTRVEDDLRQLRTQTNTGLRPAHRPDRPAQPALRPAPVARHRPLRPHLSHRHRLHLAQSVIPYPVWGGARPAQPAAPILMPAVQALSALQPHISAEEHAAAQLMLHVGNRP